MKPNTENWLRSPNVNPKWCLSVVLFWSIVLGLFGQTKLANDISNKVTLSSYFRFRNYMGKSEKIDPKIKVFAFDDKTVFQLGRPSLTMLEWVDLVKQIDKKKPKMIVFDLMFALMNMPASERAETLAALQDLDDVNASLVIGTYSVTKARTQRSVVSLDHKDFQLKTYLKLPINKKKLNIDNFKSPVVSFGHNEILGPDERLRPFIDHIGNISYDETGGSVFYPYVKVGKENVLPHLMMYAAKNAEFYRGKLYVNRKILPLKDNNTAYVNYAKPIDYYKKIKPLIRLIDNKTKQRYLETISEGDIVYFIPEYFTGGTDFKQTPVGLLAGGIVNFAILNSILKDDWLRPSKFNLLYLILGATLGALIALNTAPFAFFSLFAGTIFCWTGLCLYLFAYKGIVMPLVFPALAFALSMIRIFVEKVREADKKSNYIHQALEGVVKPNELKNIALRPEKLKLEARERIVSVMFIDVVGFSLMIERELPRIAFDSLKKVLSEMTDIVHSYDGIVNKNLGDGLLCFFGYSIETDTVSFDHADKAVACALEIQRKNIDFVLSSDSDSSLAYPLRIGINTSSVYIGNLGAGDRLDLNIVGNGVNFAKRLESGASSNQVMIGKTTKELIEPLNLYNSQWTKKYIPIKHHDELVEAWEINPFIEEEEKLKLAEVKQNDIISEIKKVNIWSELKSRNILIISEYGKGTVQSYSMEGLNLIFNEEYIKGSKLTIRIDTEDMSLGLQLKEKGIEFFDLEVSSSYEDGDRFMHSTRFVSADKDRISSIINLIKQFDSINPV